MPKRIALIAFLALLVVEVAWGQGAPTVRRPSARLPSRSHPLLSPRALRNYFRPTVTIRQGNGRGSGTIIRSVRDETLVLTAAHVVASREPLEVEIHPHNLGIEKNERELVGTGPWPRLVPAELMSADASADVAVVRIVGGAPLPYVAHIDMGSSEPRRDEILTSIGVVSGTDLTGWRTDLKQSLRIDLSRFTKRGRPGDARRFTITTKPPEFGRSGGGLFRPDGTVVGVCVGRLSIDHGPEVGVFASMESIRNVLRPILAARDRTDG